MSERDERPGEVRSASNSRRSMSLGIKICTVATLALITGVANGGDIVANPIPVFLFSGTNGANPCGGLTLGNDGNFYGVTRMGGAFSRGTVFQMSTNGALATLVSFDGTNGSYPYAGVVQGNDGDLYGTTDSGGANHLGNVFRLSLSGSLTTLVSFAGTNGSYPFAKLLQGQDGNLYGTTYGGGDNSLGTIFQLTTNGFLTTLVSFAGTNGANPSAGLIQGSNGVLYGTTYTGGAGNLGTVFQVTTNGTLATLTSLGVSTGVRPYAGVVSGRDGKLYGVTSTGGAKGYGTVFQTDLSGLTRVLFSFTNSNSGSSWDGSPLLQPADGNLYGTVFHGGANSAGQVFRITPDGTYNSLADFIVNNGSGPAGSLVVGADGAFYGVTDNGGYLSLGVVFRLNVSMSLPSISTQPQSQMAIPGSNVVFSVTATGQWPLFYHWSKYGSPETIGTNATYAITNAQLMDAGVYSVQVSNVIGSVGSSNAVLSVGPVAITQQPSNATVAVGYDTGFGIAVASTSSVVCQWKGPRGDILNATNTSLTVTNVQYDDAGSYSVVVSNVYGSVTSAIAALTVVSPYTFGTVAGTAGTPGEVDGTWNSARFSVPVRVAVGAEGNLYVSDYFANTIRKIAPDGQVSTLAGLAGVAGTNDDVGSAARFNYPEGLAVDSATNVYVADNFNHTIRKITPDGRVTTVAGVPGVAGLTDGPSLSARFSQPSDVAVDRVGNLFVADWANRAIRKISSNGVVTTVARTVNHPTGIAADGNGNLYFADESLFASGSVRKIIPGAAVTILAAVSTELYGIALDPAGNCFVGTLYDGAIREVTSDGRIFTLAGVSGTRGYADGAGQAARFNVQRMGLAIDAWGNLYAADANNCVIRKGVPFDVATAPLSQAALAGTPVTLSAALAETNVNYFQWLSNGMAIPGQTNLTFSIGALERTNSGWYTIVISNTVGNSVQLNALVRALVPPMLQNPQIASNAIVHLFFQDSDGGVPYDLSKVQVQWRTNVTDRTWQTLTNAFLPTNGLIGIDDTNVVGLSSRFYRVLEQ